MIRPTVGCVLIVLVVSGCSPNGSESRKTAGVQDVPTMTSILRGQIPSGTPLVVARDFMEQEGFTCSVQRNGSFAGQEVTREGIDYIYGDRKDGSVASVTHRRWQVALVLESDEVVDVNVSTGLIGP